MKKKTIIISVLVALVVIAVAAVTVTAVTSKSRMVKEQIALGDRYLEDLDYEKAILAYTKAIEADPKSATAYYGLAQAHIGMDSPENAKAALIKSISLNEGYTEAYLDLADLYIRQNELEEAAELLSQAINHTDDEEIQELYAQTNPAPPVFSLESGSYDTYQQVTITAGKGETIYYTEDGSDPVGEEENAVYEWPMVLRSGRTHLKAIAVNALGYKSEVAEAEYQVTAVPKEVTFADPEMENYVRSMFYNFWDPIYDEDLAQIRWISIVGPNYITDGSTTSMGYSGRFTADTYELYDSVYENSGNLQTLADLKYMPFLQEVCIAFQEDLSLSGIGNHEYLTSVSLIHNGITSISGLTELPALTALSLGWNNISDISPLSSLTGLTSLGLWGNRITDLSPLSGLTGLTYLDFSDNLVSDLTPVGELPVLESLWMYGNQVSDLTPVTTLPSIRTLMIRDNPVADYAPVLQIYPRLKRLDVNVRAETD